MIFVTSSIRSQDFKVRLNTFDTRLKSPNSQISYLIHELHDQVGHLGGFVHKHLVECDDMTHLDSQIFLLPSKPSSSSGCELVWHSAQSCQFYVQVYIYGQTMGAPVQESTKYIMSIRPIAKCGTTSSIIQSSVFDSFNRHNHADNQDSCDATSNLLSCVCTSKLWYSYRYLHNKIWQDSSNLTWYIDCTGHCKNVP